MAFPELRIHEAPHIVRYPTRWIWKTQTGSSYWTFAYFLQGHGEIRVHGQRETLSPGSALLLPPATLVNASSLEGSPMSNFSLHVSPRKAGSLDLLDRPRYRRLRSLQPRLMKELVLQCAALGSSDDWEDSALLEAYARLILAQFRADAEQAKPLAMEERIREVGLAVQAAPEEDWSVPRIAQDLGLSASQTSLRFKQIFGKALMTYVIDLRVEKAKMMLRHSSLQVSEVADALGYRDVFFFSRQFKARTGTSPSGFRKKPVP